MYADDFVCCFQYKNEAELFTNKLLLERLKKFNLEIAKDKTRLISFGRYAKENSLKAKADTFDFLEFTHYCSQSKKGYFRVKRKTSSKKFRAKVKEYKIWLKENRNKKVKDIISITNMKLKGHYRYYGVTDNFNKLDDFRNCITELLYKWLNRRSQKKSYTGEGFYQLLQKYPILSPKIYVNIYDIM